MAGKSIIAALRCFFVFCFFLFLTAGAVPALASEDATGAKKAILEVFEYLKQAHISHPKADQLLEGAAQGMIDSLKDPYTTYLNEDAIKHLSESLDGEYGGIGIYLEGRSDYPRVQEVFPGSPALEAGLKAGDSIKKVDGVDIRGWPLTTTVEKIKGPVNTEVVLTIDRGAGEITFRLKRKLLNIPTIESRLIGKNTGYIDVKTFGAKTPEQFESHLNRLISGKIGGLVIDLRDNPGGYLDAALEMAEMFVDPGAPILITKNYDGTVTKYLSERDAKLVKVPVLVLVNSQSASSSEILAGALEDNGAASLVGEKTFGKGTAQSLIRLATGGALKLTTTEYTTPAGKQVNNRGLKPDYEVQTRELQLPFALGMLEPGPREIIFNSGEKEAAVGGEKIAVRNPPLVREGSVYLPLRFTLEALGFVVAWDQESGGITAQKQDLRMTVPAQGNPVLNGREIQSGGGVLVEDGISYISPDLIKNLGYTVTTQGDGIVVGG